MTDYQTILETEKPRGKVAKALWKDVRNTSWSGQAIARNVHGRFGRRWTLQEDTMLTEAFDACQKAVGHSYSLANKSQRKEVIQALAVKMKRSPASLLIRLRDLGLGESLKRAPKPPSRQELTDIIQSATTGSDVAVAQAVPQNPTRDALDALLADALKPKGS